jgi:hypothetical protein
MLRYIIVSVVGGILFGAMDGLINANAFAQKLFAVYQPIARTTVNVPAGIVIDLAYGFIMAGLFLLLYQSLPGKAGIVKGFCYALIVWFFRVVMSAITQWMTFDVPATTLLYTLLTGLGEMLVLGVLYGLALHPTT